MHRNKPPSSSCQQDAQPQLGVWDLLPFTSRFGCHNQGDQKHSSYCQGHFQGVTDIQTVKSRAPDTLRPGLPLLWTDILLPLRLPALPLRGISPGIPTRLCTPQTSLCPLRCPGWGLAHRRCGKWTWFSPRGCVQMSGDMFDRHNWGKLLASIGWRSGMLLNILWNVGLTLQVGNILRVTLEKPCSRETMFRPAWQFPPKASPGSGLLGQINLTSSVLRGCEKPSAQCPL